MRPISCKRHRFPADVIRHAVWLYFRLTLSFRDVEELLAQRGIEVSYETIRCWTIKFGPQIARNLKRRRPGPSPRWHLDEMVCTIGGRRMYLWRAVDDEGEVLDLMMQKRRDTEVALKLLKRLLRNSSMGRLTLNVLLSFAQFEREVTGERIRDKLAASKAKGMWMGGNLPLGYDRPVDQVTRALVVNEVEAEQVRLIFRRYLELRSVHLLAKWLDQQAIRSKRYATLKGREIGGQAFSRGALFHLLKNGLYLGEITHKQSSYRGAHLAIVDREIFAAAQALMTEQRRSRGERSMRGCRAPLAGLIFDHLGAPMSPAVSYGRSKQPYRYYVAAALQQGRSPSAQEAPIRRVPAQMIETFALEHLTRFSGAPEGALTWGKGRAMLARIELLPEGVSFLVKMEAFGSLPIRHAVHRVERTLHPGEQAEEDYSGRGQVRITVPTRLRLRGGRTWLLSESGGSTARKRRLDRALVNRLKSAHRVLRSHNLDPHGRVDQLRMATSPVSTYERKLCRLALLAPDIPAGHLRRCPPARPGSRQVVGRPDAPGLG